MEEAISSCPVIWRFCWTSWMSQTDCGGGVMVGCWPQWELWSSDLHPAGMVIQTLVFFLCLLVTVFLIIIPIFHGQNLFLLQTAWSMWWVTFSTSVFYHRFWLQHTALLWHLCHFNRVSNEIFYKSTKCDNIYFVLVDDLVQVSINFNSKRGIWPSFSQINRLNL